MKPGVNRHYRLLAPEVIQTSAMDCGPAALKCLLEGFNIPVSYGRLREACQTDLDGTSIEAIDAAANQLGLSAEQVMLPVDHLWLEQVPALPAMIVTQRGDGAMHFVVIWRQFGPWLQIMDPAVGRRWIKRERFANEIFRHDLMVSAEDWLQWALSDEFGASLATRLRQLGIKPQASLELMAQAELRGDWEAMAALDAAVRMVYSLCRGGAVARGKMAGRMLNAVWQDAVECSHFDRMAKIPLAYWTVQPASADDDTEAPTEPQLILRGAVLVRINGRRDANQAIAFGGSAAGPELSPELRAALDEKPIVPEREIWRLLSFSGWITPAALVAALVLSVGAVLAESLLFRGLFDIARDLGLAGQRVGALAGLLLFMAMLMLLEIPIAAESLRLGRRLELRLRMALQEKMATLGDRYFQSRPISDLAERAHSVYLTRMVPDLAIRFVRSLFDLGFTVAGIALIAPTSAGPAMLLGGLAIALPLIAQPLLNERELRVRSHGGALYGFYLDALRGLVAVRAHAAERAVQREHEGRMVEWLRSSRGLIFMSLAIQALQAIACFGVVGWLLYASIAELGITGNVLLLVFWTLKLPAVGKQIATLAKQYPAERNALLRLLEPLAAPSEEVAITAVEPDKTEPLPSQAHSAARSVEVAVRYAEEVHGVAIKIGNGSVVAAGHTLLRDVDLEIRPGEHVAIVGPSGAGKSTLLGLLLGWHRLATGGIEVNGRPFDGAALTALRRRTAWVDPAAQLWNRSLLDNLRFADDSPELQTDVGQVLASATLRELVQKLPEGLQTPLGESGSLVSGGEGQRVRLGRALMQRNVDLALLDEPFRGLDHRQRRILLRQCRAWWKGKTLLCVTHDLRETLEFERVLVIENGAIIEDGVPGDLAASQSRYRQLLEAEETVRAELWQADCWQRLRMEQGKLSTPIREESHVTRRSQHLSLARG